MLQSIRTALPVFLALGLAAFAAQQAAPQAGARPGLESVSGSVSGKDLFNSFCAVCHGLDGKGHGPAASSFRTRPSNLTALAKKNHGKFPAAEVTKELSSIYQAPHGSKDMPIWGPYFSEMSPKSEDLGALRIANIVAYIQSMQTK